MPPGILTLFSIGLCTGVVCVVLFVLWDLSDFRWLAALRRFRYSLLSLFGLTSALATALGMQNLQEQFPAGFYMPFPATLLVCLVAFGLLAALVGEFSSRSFRRSASPTALESFRIRQQQEALSRTTEDTSQQAAGTSDQPQRKSRWKWWLRPMPNRFRSISHRDPQAANPQGYYIRGE